MHSHERLLVIIVRLLLKTSRLSWHLPKLQRHGTTDGKLKTVGHVTSVTVGLLKKVGLQILLENSQ